MGIGYWLLRPWRLAFSFSGRSPRREYWLFVLQTYVLALCMVFVAYGVDDNSSGVRVPVANTILILAGLFWIASLIPWLAVAVRRMHDQNKSGVLLLLGLVPFVGGFILLFFMVTPSDEYENDYGPNPLDLEAMPGVSEVFE